MNTNCVEEEIFIAVSTAKKNGLVPKFLILNQTKHSKLCWELRNLTSGEVPVVDFYSNLKIVQVMDDKIEVLLGY